MDAKDVEEKEPGHGPRPRIRDDESNRRSSADEIVPDVSEKGASRPPTPSRLNGRADTAQDDARDKPAVDSEAQSEEPVKDPYEVGWDGGDNDPMCPRSMGTARKWMIVIITSIGSMCA